MKPMFLFASAGWLLTAVTGQSADAASAAKPSAPAKVITENDLTTLTLKPEAEQRLGITTALLEVKKVERHRLLGGEVLLPLGRAENPTNTGASSKSIF